MTVARGRGRGPSAHLALLLLLLGAVPARAQGPAPESPRVSGGTWALAGAALAASFLYDGLAHEEMYLEGNDEARGLAEAGNALATPAVLAPSFGGIYLAGLLLDRPAWSEGAVDGVVGLAAATTVTQILKVAVGRPRPSVAATDGDELHPFTLDSSYHSFPSGHTAAVFSVATTVAMETHDPWLATAAYGAAGLTAWARVHDNRHWLSDTAAGALVGTAVTHYVIHRMRNRRAGSGAPELELGPTGVELTLHVP